MKYLHLVFLLFLCAYSLDDDIPDRSEFPDETNGGRLYCMYAIECKSMCSYYPPFACPREDRCIVIKASKVHESEYEDFVKIDGDQLIRARIDPKTKELCVINVTEGGQGESCFRPFEDATYFYLYKSTPAGSRIFHMHFIRTKGSCKRDDYGYETIKEKAPYCM